MILFYFYFARPLARLDKVGRSDELRRNTGKGTPVTAELVGMHMVKPLRASLEQDPLFYII